MFCFLKPLYAIAFFAISLTLLGCNGNGDSASPSGDDHSEHAHDGEHEEDGHDGEHAHPTEGPHHGSLIELGNEEYHAELLHDEQSGAVTIYILDGSAKNSVPIVATEITINLKHDGRGEQFKLAASPDEGDPQGKSSRFVSNDPELGSDLDHEGAEARLVLDVAGKSFTGEIGHHDHGHGHD